MVFIFIFINFVTLKIIEKINSKKYLGKILYITKDIIILWRSKNLSWLRLAALPTLGEYFYARLSWKYDIGVLPLVYIVMVYASHSAKRD